MGYKANKNSMSVNHPKHVNDQSGCHNLICCTCCRTLSTLSAASSAFDDEIEKLMKKRNSIMEIFEQYKMNDVRKLEMAKLFSYETLMDTRTELEEFLDDLDSKAVNPLQSEIQSASKQIEVKK